MLWLMYAKSIVRSLKSHLFFALLLSVCGVSRAQSSPPYVNHWTGTQRVMVMFATFSDSTSSGYPGDAAWNTITQNFRTWIQQKSYGKTDFEFSYVQFHFNEPSRSFDFWEYHNKLAVEAQRLGIDLNPYHRLWAVGQTQGATGWATVNGRHMQIAFGYGEHARHEFGHTFGTVHPAGWDDSLLLAPFKRRTGWLRPSHTGDPFHYRHIQTLAQTLGTHTVFDSENVSKPGDAQTHRLIYFSRDDPRSPAPTNFVFVRNEGFSVSTHGGRLIVGRGDDLIRPHAVTRHHLEPGESLVFEYPGSRAFSPNFGLLNASGTSVPFTVRVTFDEIVPETATRPRGAVFTITQDSVTPPPPIVVTRHPESLVSVVGDTVTFSVDVSGIGPFDYQWFRNGSPIFAATSRELVLHNVSLADEGAYFVRVGNAAAPNVTSEAASLGMQNLPQITLLTPGVLPLRVIPGAETLLEVSVLEPSGVTGHLKILWEALGGGAGAGFRDSQGSRTSVFFAEPGSHTLRVSADNGLYRSHLDIPVEVVPADMLLNPVLHPAVALTPLRLDGTAVDTYPGTSGGGWSTAWQISSTGPTAERIDPAVAGGETPLLPGRGAFLRFVDGGNNVRTLQRQYGAPADHTRQDAHRIEFLIRPRANRFQIWGGSLVNNQSIGTANTFRFFWDPSNSRMTVYDGSQTVDLPVSLAYGSAYRVHLHLFPATRTYHFRLENAATGETLLFRPDLGFNGATTVDGWLRFAGASGASGSSYDLDDLEITFQKLSNNVAPLADGGGDRVVQVNTPFALEGTWLDDGLPLHPGQVSAQWQQISGPAALDLSTPASVTAPAAGVYELRFVAHDGALAGSDTVRITAVPPGQPALVSPGTLLSKVGTPFEAELVWAGHGVSSLSVSGLPAGLSLTSGGTRISGTPAPETAGDYELLFFANGSSTAAASRGLTVLSEGGNLLAPVVRALSPALLDASQVILQGELLPNVAGAGVDLWVAPQSGPEAGIWTLRRSLWAVPGTFSVLLGDLTPDTSYAYRWEASAAGLSFSGETLVFSTPPNLYGIRPEATLLSPEGRPVRVPMGMGLWLQTTVIERGGTSPGVSILWEMLEGPAPVQWDNPAAASTGVRFDAPGLYRLAMTASNGINSDHIEIDVEVVDPALIGDNTPWPEAVLGTTLMIASGQSAFGMPTYDLEEPLTYFTDFNDLPVVTGAGSSNFSFVTYTADARTTRFRNGSQSGFPAANWTHNNGEVKTDGTGAEKSFGFDRASGTPMIGLRLRNDTQETMGSFLVSYRAVAGGVGGTTNRFRFSYATTPSSTPRPNMSLRDGPFAHPSHRYLPGLDLVTQQGVNTGNGVFIENELFIPAVDLQPGEVLWLMWEEDTRRSSNVGFDRISVTPLPTPRVNIGPYAAASASAAVEPGASVDLARDVADEGLPVKPGAVAWEWTTHAGPVSAALQDAEDPALATAGFPQSGTYVLRLYGDDGAIRTFREKTVIVGPVSGDAFTAWLSENSHHFPAGADGDTWIERGGTPLRVRDVWIAGLDPATQDLFRITGWDEHGRPAFSPRLPEGRVYEIFWTDNLSQEPVTWHLLPDGAPMPPSSPVFFRVQVRVE